MSDALVLYTNPMSRGRIARWMLEEIGRPYRAEIVEYGPPMKGEAFRRLNPLGKVPVLAHGATVVSETAAICAYLADAFPEAGLAPAVSDPSRGSYYRALFLAAGPVEAAVTNRALGVEVPPERQGMVGYGSFAAVMDALEAVVSPGPYILGARFSAADIYPGSQIGFGLRFGSIEDRPAFRRYWAGLEDRPAAVRAREIDDALLAGAAKG